MKIAKRSQLDLWISGIALFIAILLLIASAFVRTHPRHRSADLERSQFIEQSHR